MVKTKSVKITVILSIITLVSMGMIVQPASALLSQNNTGWFWTSDTYVSAMTMADVDANGQEEIITIGNYNDGLHWGSQIVELSPATLTVLRNTGWNWGDNMVSSLAVGNVTGGRSIDIVTGGAFYDGNRWVAQLLVWNASTLAYQRGTAWYWTGDTQISSVAVANITGGTTLDIVTGGSFFDGTRKVAQLIVWNGSTLVAEMIQCWYWTSNTYINSVAVANLTGNATQSIITGGVFNDGTRNVAQLIVWNASNLALTRLTSWYWTGNTEINSLAAANVTGGTSLDIVTGGSFFDGTRTVAQLINWNSSTMVAQKIAAWYWTGNTNINSLAVASFTGGANLEIITGGSFFDGTRNNGQIITWNSGTMAATSFGTWFTTSNTRVNSVVMRNIPLQGNRIIGAGQFYDNVRENAQVTMWG